MGNDLAKAPVGFWDPLGLSADGFWDNSMVRKCLKRPCAMHEPRFDCSSEF